MNVTVFCHYYTTSALFGYRSIPSLWYNARVVYTSHYVVIMIRRQRCLYVTVCRHRVSSFLSRHIVQREYCVIVTVHRPHDTYEATLRSGISDSHKFEPHKAPVASLIVLSVPHSMSSLLYNAALCIRHDMP